MFASSRFVLTLGLMSLTLPAQSANLLVDINKDPVPTPSHPNPGRDALVQSGRQFSVWQGKILIQALDSKTGFEPYLSDGSQAGSYRMLDLEPGVGSSLPESFTPTRDGKRFFFVATTKKSGKELYVSDGTAKGTQLIDVTPGSGDTPITGLTAFGKSGVLFFSTNASRGGVLYSSDGTLAGTRSLGQVSDQYAPHAVEVHPSGNWALFEANTDKYGREMWVTDGTSKGTRILKDIFPGTASSYSYGVTWRADGKGIFSAFDPVAGYEFWITDGTTAGTTVAVDFKPGSGSGVQEAWFGLLPGKVLFSSVTTPLGQELYISDGTGKGTVLLMDTLPGSRSGVTGDSRFASDGTRVWFTTTGLKGQLWIHVTDGTALGTKLFSPRSLKTHPQYMVADQGRVYFEHQDLSPGTGLEFCVSDGTLAGTRTLVDLFKGSGRGFFGYTTVLAKGVIAFRGESKQTAKELCVYRVGKGASFVDLNRVRLGHTQGSFPHYATRFGNRALILADDGVHGVETWISDGTVKGTGLLLDMQKGAASRAKARIGAFGDRYFYEARQQLYDPWDLMISDGTVNGTTTLVPGSTSSMAMGSRVIGKRLFFAAGTEFRSQPWVSDGTKAGTIQLSKAAVTQNAGAPGAFAGYGDQVLFMVLQGPTFRTLDTVDLWITDGTAQGTRLLKKIGKGAFWLWEPRLVTMGGKVYFTSPSQTSSSDLWVSDFTAKGTQPVQLDSQGLSRISHLHARDGRLFFQAWSLGRGDALYQSDGTRSGTRFWIDLVPTSSSSSIDMYQIVGSRRLYFFSTSFRSLGACYHRTDGTIQGTLSYDLDPSNSPPARILRRHMTSLGSQVLVAAYAPQWEEEMYSIENGATAEPLGTSSGPTWLEGSDPVQGAKARIQGGALETGLTQVLLLGSPSVRPQSAGQAGFLYLDLLGFWMVAGISQSQTLAQTYTIPNSPTLKGAQVVFQTLSFDARNLNASMRLSNGLHWTLGQ